MSVQDKHAFVDSLREQLQAAPYILVLNYEGTSVNAANDFRRELEQSGARLQVVKNTLMRRAIDDTELAGLSPYFRGMTGIVVGTEEPVTTAKAVRDALKQWKTYDVIGGYFEGDVLDAAAIKAVAELPSREELLVMLLRTIQEPGRQVLGVLQGSARDLLYLLKNYETKLAEG